MQVNNSSSVAALYAATQQSSTQPNETIKPTQTLQSDVVSITGNGGGIIPPSIEVGSGGGVIPPSVESGSGGGIIPPSIESGSGGGWLPPE